MRQIRKKTAWRASRRRPGFGSGKAGAIYACFKPRRARQTRCHARKYGRIGFHSQSSRIIAVKVREWDSAASFSQPFNVWGCPAGVSSAPFARTGGRRFGKYRANLFFAGLPAADPRAFFSRFAFCIARGFPFTPPPSLPLSSPCLFSRPSAGR